MKLLDRGCHVAVSHFFVRYNREDRELFMKTKLLIIFIILIILLMACQPATPLPPILITENSEFTLAPSQTASIVSSGLHVQLIGVAGDERCPSEIECAISGPVSISLAVQIGNGEESQIDLQTFTGNDGRTPSMQFEGIEDRAVYEGYLFQVTSVLPYPMNPTNPIKDSEYRVTLVISRKK
jgi:hypothetical protein